MASSESDHDTIIRDLEARRSAAMEEIADFIAKSARYGTLASSDEEVRRVINEVANVYVDLLEWTPETHIEVLVLAGLLSANLIDGTQPYERQTGSSRLALEASKSVLRDASRRIKLRRLLQKYWEIENEIEMVALIEKQEKDAEAYRGQPGLLLKWMEARSELDRLTKSFKSQGRVDEIGVQAIAAAGDRCTTIFLAMSDDERKQALKSVE